MNEVQSSGPVAQRGNASHDETAEVSADLLPAGPSGCLTRVRASLPHLTKSDRRIAEIVLQDPHSIILASVTELAERSRTSEAAISRFAQRLGFHGYPEFKIMLAQDLAAPVKVIHEDVEAGDDVEVLAQKITAANVQALRDTLAVLDSGSLQEAIDLLVAAERIVFFGVGGSGVIALDAQHKFLRTGKTVLAFNDTHEQAMFAAVCGPGDVIVCISHSGATRDLLESVRVARRKSPRVIAITHFGRPPLARLVDVHLCTSSRETRYRPEALSSRIATLNIIDILYVGVALRMEERVAANLTAIREALKTRRM